MVEFQAPGKGDYLTPPLSLLRAVTPIGLAAMTGEVMEGAEPETSHFPVTVMPGGHLPAAVPTGLPDRREGTQMLLLLAKSPVSVGLARGSVPLSQWVPVT